MPSTTIGSYFPLTGQSSSTLSPLFYRAPPLRTLPLHQARPHAVTHVTCTRACICSVAVQMKRQAAEAKPETKDIKAEEQKPKVPAPHNGLGLAHSSVRTLRPLIPSFRTSPSFTSVNDGSKSVLRLLNPIPLPLPSLNLVGPSCTAG